MGVPEFVSNFVRIVAVIAHGRQQPATKRFAARLFSHSPTAGTNACGALSIEAPAHSPTLCSGQGSSSTSIPADDTITSVMGRPGDDPPRETELAARRLLGWSRRATQARDCTPTAIGVPRRSSAST